ncbi:MAG: aldehyde dehydrogenase family protein [Acidobacteriota bacterium]
MLHLPILRGRRGPYRSLTVERLDHVTSGEPLAEVSQANPGLIALDYESAPQRRRALEAIPAAELIARCRRAAELFMNGELVIGADGETQSADDYVRCLSGSTGMPEALCRDNMSKLEFVFERMEQVLAGLSRGLDPSALDQGWTEEDGRTVSFLAQADTLGVILPSNSPGVHSLWLPSVALKTPLTLKPGSREPWTPLRAAAALLAAGCPPEAVAFYPTNHSGAAEILLRSGRSMLFGDRSTVRNWADDERVQLHGPGWSKVLLGADQMPHWQDHLDTLAESVAANGGRSCVNASGVRLAASGQHGRDLAEALADRLAAIEARPLDHPAAALCGFGDRRVAEALNDLIDRQLATGGAEDLTARARGGDRLVEVDGLAYLLPTVIWCDDPNHPLAQTELLFPFVSVVEVPPEDLVRGLDDSLVVTALTQDPEVHRELMGNRHIERLNLGAIPTCRVSWDQPHEGNLFEHLYRQRSFQAAG